LTRLSPNAIEAVVVPVVDVAADLDKDENALNILVTA